MEAEIKKKIKRISYSKQKDKCRDDGTAYFEKCDNCTAKMLMCGHKETKGGLCKPEKCRDVRVIVEAETVDVG